MDRFHNAGYKGLYNGETANDIAKRKNLRYREDILDNMGSEELAANLFRITQTESKLKRDNVYGEKNANETHYNIGKNIREVIAKNGGTMPEDLPTPKKSLKELEKERKQVLIGWNALVNFLVYVKEIDDDFKYTDKINTSMLTMKIGNNLLPIYHGVIIN